jgi:alkylation response protein AidB-like acyl-CoA dehydrogenase
MTYTAPLKDLDFALEAIVGVGSLAKVRAFPDFGPDIAAAVLEEAGKFASGVLAPLNRTGDQQGSKLDNGVVRTAPGFREAYRAFVEAGWNGIAATEAFGGQGLPHTLGVAVQEFWQSANMAFGLCPILTQGAIEALTAHGTDEQKRLYLARLVSGEWTGTMNLTEPQAGSDVGALKTKAVPHSDGSFRITGTKIFITWGEHDCAENIIHLVLARLPDAPQGTRGISLFLVPKFLVKPDGSLGARNDLRCVGLEHKLGIHGSPTAVMSFGDDGGAVGYLIGKENKGMACMFTMMNSARLNVGVQGVAIAERAYQQALAYARDRKQGKPFGLQHEGAESVAIIEHPDVRRMLLTMKANIEAARAICLSNAFALDMARHHPDADERARWKSREELLTPLSKAWSTDMGIEMTSLGVQIHGGMGFIEETGAAQHYRDARILPIYEGTNGIQAIDLVSRKLSLDRGGAVRAFLKEVETNVASLLEDKREPLEAIGRELVKSMGAAESATAWLQDRMGSNQPSDVLAGATPYLKLLGSVAGAHFLAIGARAAADRIERGDKDEAFLRTKIVTALFFAESILAPTEGLLTTITAGSDRLENVVFD